MAETVGIGAEGLGVLMAAQHHEDLVVLAEELVPHHLRRVCIRIERMVVDHRIGFARAAGLQEIMHGDDRRQPGIALDDLRRPFERGIGGIELQADMQEFVAASGEDLGIVRPAIMACHIPGLVPEEVRLIGEHPAPVVEPRRMQQAQVALGLDLGLLRVVGIGPLGIIIVVAGNGRPGHLAVELGIGLADLGGLDGHHLGGRGQQLVDEGIVAAPEAARGKAGIDRQRLVLPGIAQRDHEVDVAPLAAGVIGHELHLLHQHRRGIESEAFLFLMRVIDVILRVGDHRDGEALVGRRLGPGQRRHDQHGGGEKGSCKCHDLYSSRIITSSAAGWRHKSPDRQRRRHRRQATGRHS